MQTFAPEGRDIRKGFECLDRQRLGKQRVETYQILRVHLGFCRAWETHPAVKMWKDDIFALAEYGRVNCVVWKERGYKDNLQPIFETVLRVAHQHGERIAMPIFLDWISASHRANLVRKDPEHYGDFWHGVDLSLPYLWPGKVNTR